MYLQYRSSHCACDHFFEMFKIPLGERGGRIAAITLLWDFLRAAPPPPPTQLCYPSLFMRWEPHTSHSLVRQHVSHNELEWLTFGLNGSARESIKLEMPLCVCARASVSLSKVMLGCFVGPQVHVKVWTCVTQYWKMIQQHVRFNFQTSQQKGK